MSLATKYRPRDFDELVGQDSVRVSLKYALDNKRLAHAYLFSGLRGSGKTSSARIFARALICESGPTSKPCGVCPGCINALANKHPDIVEMDAASNRGLEEIKALIEQTKYAPMMGRYKIFIIDEVHMITPQAANALLKTLEEPPAYVKFILATTDPLKLPATILSRTQHFRFRQINELKIQEHLKSILQKEGVSFEDAALKLISRSASGSLRDTLTTLDQAIIYCKEDITEDKIASMLGLLDPKKIEEFYKLILSCDKDGVLDFLKSVREYEASNIIDEMVFYLKEAFFSKSELFSSLLYERYFKILSRAKGMLKTTDDEDFVLCVMSFMLIEAASLGELKDEIVRIQTPVLAKNAQISIQSEQSPINQPQSAYDGLIKILYNRDYELGECFEKVCELRDENSSSLSILTHASGEDARYLNNNFKLIMKLFNENFPSLKLYFQKAASKDENAAEEALKTKPQNTASKREDFFTKNKIFLDDKLTKPTQDNSSNTFSKPPQKEALNTSLQNTDEALKQNEAILDTPWQDPQQDKILDQNPDILTPAKQPINIDEDIDDFSDLALHGFEDDELDSSIKEQLNIENTIEDKDLKAVKTSNDLKANEVKTSEKELNNEEKIELFQKLFTN